MSEHAAAGTAPPDQHEPHPTEIYVNTRPVSYAGKTIDYTQAVDLAFPGLPKGPDVTFAVTYSGGQGHGGSGALVEGGAAVHVRKGMSIDVIHSNRS